MAVRKLELPADGRAPDQAGVRVGRPEHAGCRLRRRSRTPRTHRPPCSLRPPQPLQGPHSTPDPFPILGSVLAREPRRSDATWSSPPSRASPIDARTSVCDRPRSQAGEIRGARSPRRARSRSVSFECCRGALSIVGAFVLDGAMLVDDLFAQLIPQPDLFHGSVDRGDGQRDECADYDALCAPTVNASTTARFDDVSRSPSHAARSHGSRTSDTRCTRRQSR